MTPRSCLCVLWTSGILAVAACGDSGGSPSGGSSGAASVTTSGSGGECDEADGVALDLVMTLDGASTEYMTFNALGLEQGGPNEQGLITAVLKDQAPSFPFLQFALKVPDPDQVVDATLAEQSLTNLPFLPSIIYQESAAAPSLLVGTDADMCVTNLSFVEHVVSGGAIADLEAKRYDVDFDCGTLPWDDLLNGTTGSFSGVTGEFDVIISVLTN